MQNMQDIINKIKNMGPVLPGSLDAYYTVCGKPTCRCRDKQNPQKHGPYYRLCYSLGGKNSSMFVKQQDAEAVQTMVNNYKELRELTTKLALTTLDSVKQEGVAEIIQQYCSDSIIISTADLSWKEKCREISRKLRAAAINIRDLKNSRDKWRKESLQWRDKARTTKTKQLKHEMDKLGGKK